MTEQSISLERLEETINVFGSFDENIRIIEGEMEVSVVSRDSMLKVSGENAENVMYAAVTARAKGMRVIAVTGNTGRKLGAFADISIIVPEQETYKIQELHLPIYHALCLMLEERFYER